MLIPFVILFFGSVFSGYLFRDLFIGLGSDYWDNSVKMSLYNVYILESEFIVIFIKLMPVVFSLIG
jgi:NADH-ubiquinone oxidoreductase chain 5